MFLKSTFSKILKIVLANYLGYVFFFLSAKAPDETGVKLVKSQDIDI